MTQGNTVVDEAFSHFYTLISPLRCHSCATRARICQMCPKLKSIKNAPIGSIHIVGSVMRKTDLRDLSDVDVMVEFFPGAFDITEVDSREMIGEVKSALQDVPGVQSVRDKGEVVGVEYPDGSQIEIQPVIPATPTGYALPDGAGGWIATDPFCQEKFLNTQAKVSPVDLRSLIRGLKYWNFHQGKLLSSYHIEVIASRLAGNFSRTFASANLEFFRLAQGNLNQSDPADHRKVLGQSIPELQLRTIIQVLAEAEEQSRSAVHAEKSGSAELAIAKWHALFGHPFPTG